MELDEALGEVSSELNEARTCLDKALKRYDARSDDLLERAVEAVKAIKDPTHGHSASAGLRADALLARLSDVVDVASELREAAGAMLFSFTGATTLYGLAMIQFPRVDPAAGPGGLADAWEAAFAEANAKIASAAVTLIVMGREVADLLAAAADLLDTRLEVTRTYLGAVSDDLPPPETHRVRAAFTTLTIGGAEIALDEFLKKAGVKVLEQVPAVGLGVTGLEVVYEIHKEAKEARERQAALREVYHQRNELDDMDDYEADLLRQDDGLGALTATLDAAGKRFAELEPA